MEEEGGDHCDDAVADGPANNGPGATFCADVEREDFRGIEPGGGEPGGAEGGRVEECESCDAGTEGALVRALDLGVFVEDAGDEEFDGHGDGAPDQCCWDGISDWSFWKIFATWMVTKEAAAYIFDHICPV